MPPGLQNIEQAVEDHVQQSMSVFRSVARWGSPPDYYVVKYLSLKHLGDFLKEDGQGHGQEHRLFASSTPGYTWGDAVYVAPLSCPFSSMMFGRAAIVGRISPQRVFDATDHRGVALYQEWIQYQWVWYDILTTTMHANRANQYLRNRFRTTFQIDCVLFPPDQFSAGYVGPFTDTWLAITHWVDAPFGQKVGSGESSAVAEPEWCAIIAEEFHVQETQVMFDAVVGPAMRGVPLRRSEITARAPALANALLTCYQQLRVRPNRQRNVPLLVVHP